MLVLKDQEYTHIPSQDLIGKAWKYPISGQQDLGLATGQVPLPPDDPQAENPYKEAKYLNRNQCVFIGLLLGSGGQEKPGSGHRCLIPYLQKGKNPRSEEHTSELQSRQYLVCRLLLEKKK